MKWRKRTRRTGTRRIIGESLELDASMRETYAKTLKENGIRLTDTQRREIESRYGSVSEWRKRMFGRVKVSHSGISLDSLWSELSGRNREAQPDGGRITGGAAAVRDHAHAGMGRSVRGVSADHAGIYFDPVMDNESNRQQWIADWRANKNEISAASKKVRGIQDLL